MIKPKNEWCLLEPDHSLVTKFEQELEIPQLIAKILVNRGITELEAAREFLEVEKQDWHDPFLFFDMHKTVDRIKQAVQLNENIVIFGDYDADGVTSTAIMMLALEKLGSKNHRYYIPNRFSEGYGPNKAALETLQSVGAQLIISVDTGISAIEEIRFSKEIGIDFIVTDHHQMGHELPEAYSIIHPMRTELEEVYKDLSGAGVALKLAQALLGNSSDELLAIAAIGTVSDLVALLGENRKIVFQGLKAIRHTKLPGLIALSQNAGLDMNAVNEDSIGFVFAPRINAAGRLGSADLAVDLLLSSDMDTAKHIAKQLETLNKERQEIVQKSSLEAVEMVNQLYPAEAFPVIVVAKEGWNTGVIGIVASKLVDKFNRPAVVLSIDPETGEAKGSARSINGFDLYENISKLGDKLIHFGGHPMAAGLTINQEDIQALRDLLCNMAEVNICQVNIQVDTCINLDEINSELVRQLESLAPFGVKNPKPLIQIDRVFLHSARKIGSECNHLKAVISNKKQNLDMVGFGFGSKLDEISESDSVSLVGHLSINEWKNVSKPQLMLQDISCNSIQIFDFRSNPITQSNLKSIPSPRKFFLFNEVESNRVPLEFHKEILSKQLDLLTVDDFKDSENLVIVDLPSNIHELEKLFKIKQFSKIYLFLKSDSEKMFQTIPSREKFMKVYGFLLANSPFDYDRNQAQLAKSLGFSKDLLDFIISVFFDLSFVTIDNGFVHVEKNVTKRPLDESQVYLQKQAQMEFENMLLFSTREEITIYFQQLQSNLI
ncbi:MAG: recJ [Bacillales bacterium]|jgi:single-stranded-DNA-specific exonuclease|nr:recJ [Bacillales bacterium]